MKRVAGLLVVLSLVAAPFCLVAGVGTMGIGLLVVDRIWIVSVPATVKGKTWSRIIEVERWERVERSGWCDDVPEGAEIVDREMRTAAAGRMPRRRQRHDHGHGHGHTRRAWCKYRIDDWAAEPSRRAAGSGDEPRVWPRAPRPDACPEPVRKGCRRGSVRIERLEVALVPEGGSRVVCVVSESVWTPLALGQQVELPISAVFGRPRCDRL